MTLALEGRTFGPGKPALIVAEISGNHCGQYLLAKQLVNNAALAGADAVKFQCFTPEELVILRGDGPAPAPWTGTLRDLWERNQTPREWFPNLFAEARALGLIPFSSVFGAESLAFLESLDCPAYKLSAAEYANRTLRELVRRTKKPILQSRPCAGPFVSQPWESDVIYLFCPPGYPQTPSPWLLQGIANVDGFSCHSRDTMLGPMAVAHGAWVLEWHLYSTYEAPDRAFALDPMAFRRLVREVRQAESAIGIA